MTLRDLLSLRKKARSGSHVSTAFEVANFFHSTADNIGDRMCGPAQYLWPAAHKNLPLEPHNGKLDRVIIGGGQTFSELGTCLSAILHEDPRARVVAWGVGLPPKGRKDAEVREMAQGFALFGTRNYDWRDELDFVPCASCLSPLFDGVPPPTHEVVFFLHKKKGGQITPPPGAPVLTNAAHPAENVISLIASGEIVVTSSYHGVYWAQLLGRKVICIPYNSKFDTFEYRPTMAEPDTWQNALRSAVAAPPLLDEYRAINLAFGERAMGLWNG